MLEDMYPAMLNSPATELADNINSTQTTIKVNDLSKLPDPPNIATLGTTEDCETILYESIDVASSTLTNVTRGFEGVAKAWGQGTPVHRTFTARDYEAMRQNILHLLSALGAHQQASPLDHPDGSVTAAKIAEGAINALAKIAATIRTTAGGTEANRLAVTDGDGAVGLAREAMLAQEVAVHHEVFTASGTWTKPEGISFVYVEIIDGGGGGDGGAAWDSITPNQAGVGGMMRTLFLPADFVPNTVPVIVGAGGAGGVGSNTNIINPGGLGGASQFGDYKATEGNYRRAGDGGRGGTSRYNNGLANDGQDGAGPAGGAGGKGVFAQFGNHGEDGGDGDASIYRLGSGGGGGGAARWAGSGRTFAIGGNGGDGGAPGGGGGSGGQATAEVYTNSRGGHGGNGARGEVRIWAF